MQVWEVCVLVCMFFYFRGGCNLQLSGCSGYFGQGLLVDSDDVLGSGTSGAPSFFFFCDHVVFF